MFGMFCIYMCVVIALRDYNLMDLFCECPVMSNFIGIIRSLENLGDVTIEIIISSAFGRWKYLQRGKYFVSLPKKFEKVPKNLFVREKI